MQLSFIISAVILTFVRKTEPKVSHSSNVCKRYIDYLFMDTSENCYYNPELLLQTNEIIEKHIGFCETYNATTEDGYILTIFRIPKQNPKGVVLMLHPVTTDAIVWVSQSNESFAFLLWNSGYDVWLPNNRGTYFSRKHVNLSSQDDKYWDFSFHEIGLYDYKTIIDFVKKKTNNSEIIVISHSMSTTSSLIYASLNPEETANSVKIFITMSPVAYLKHVRSPLKYMAQFIPYFQFVNKLLHINHVEEYDDESVNTLRTFMLTFRFKYLYSMMLSAFQGWNPQEFDPALINLAVGHHPRSYSWKIIYHFAQQFLSGGRFQMYDYGHMRNKKLYGTVVPPEYPVDDIISPVYLVYSDEDPLATVEDVELLYSKLNPRAKIYGKLRISGMNHIDYHFGKHRKEKVFNKIIMLLERL